MTTTLRLALLVACVAAATMAAPRLARQASATRPVTPGQNRGTTPTPTPKTTTKAPTAVDICAGADLSEQLVLVCAQLRTQKEEEERLNRAKAEASCLEIIQPELKKICIDLELSKLTEPTTDGRTRAPTTAAPATKPTAKTATTRPATEPTGIPPRGQTTRAPTTTTGSARLVDLFGNLFGGSGGTDNINVDEIAANLGQRARETFESAVEGSMLENVDLGEVAEKLNNGGLAEVFGRLSGSSLDSVRPILADTELSRPQKANLIKDFLEARGFDVDQLGLSNTGLLSTFQTLVNQNADPLSGSSGLSALLSNSAAGEQMAQWAQQLVKIWQANSAGLMKLPKPDLAAVLEAGQSLLPATSAGANVEASAEAEVATNKGVGNVLGVTTAPVRSVLGDAPQIGRINPTALDGLITEEVKNQALANVFTHVSKGLFNVGK